MSDVNIGHENEQRNQEIDRDLQQLTQWVELWKTYSAATNSTILTVMQQTFDRAVEDLKRFAQEQQQVQRNIPR